MWVIAEYQATALFSLKPATATASGGKTLLVPTPFAIKMALVDIGCRLLGRERTIEMWDWLGTATVGLKPTPDVVVNNTFIKILRPPKKAKPNEPFQQTIAYREYAQLAGDFSIAIDVDEQEHADILRRWFAHINYIGKRGSFIQLQAIPQVQERLTSDWIIVGEALEDGFALDSVLTQLDDTGEDATFDIVNIYSGKRMTMGKHRILHHVALPYQRVRSSRGYTHYRLKSEGN